MHSSSLVVSVIFMMLRMLGVMLLVPLILADTRKHADPPACEDRTEDCASLKKLGYCDPNHQYYPFMEENCVRTCDLTCERIAGCIQYDSVSRCTLCTLGFHVSDDERSCTGCGVSMEECVTCTSAKTCTSCLHGYTVTADGSSCKHKDVKYEHYFPKGSLSRDSIQCTSWEGFRNLLPYVSYKSVRMYGTYNEAGLRCSDTKIVNQIASALRTGGSSELSFQCEGRTWRTGPCGDTEISVDHAFCTCTSGNAGTIRPCHGGSTWGGVNTDTCSGPSQTLGIEFTIA